MATERQVAANRANAAHSTGPRTPEGKAASKANRLTHGLDSTAPVVPGESAAEWNAHRVGIRASLAPVGPLETELADRAATLFWRLRRVVRYETGAATAALDHAVGTLTGEFDPADPVQGTFGRVSPVPTLYSVAGLRNRLADHRTGLDRQCACATLVRDLPGLAGGHPLSDAIPGQLLDGICNDECLTSITDLEVVADLNLPDEAWEDLIGWDGWTAGTVRAALGAIGKHAERTVPQLLDRAARRLDREASAQRQEITRLEEALSRAEADLGVAVELARRMNLLPELATDKVIRYEAHLSRQLNQTLQLLDRLQAARAQGRLCPPPQVDERDFERVPPAEPEIVSADRTQTGPPDSPATVAGLIPSAGQVGASADRTQSDPVGSPVVATARTPSAGRVSVSADRTQPAELFPFVVRVGGLAGYPDGVIGGVRPSARGNAPG